MRRVGTRLDVVDATWFAPPAVLLIGAAATALLLKRIGAVIDAVSDSVRRSDRLEGSLVPVRVETRRARRSLDHLDLDRR